MYVISVICSILSGMFLLFTISLLFHQYSIQKDIQALYNRNKKLYTSNDFIHDNNEIYPLTVLYKYAYKSFNIYCLYGVLLSIIGLFFNYLSYK